ncbi:MAG: hypothetical protein A2087_04550 [Spirochaetes bacterium GWD1_61_31]|nr:MAG: hypothetical protein A2Y37_06435 [Spirochaetes bacterium GWB1_60_80]OHD40588.1 MAG: hypothetical protein A2087_04550 [Spirochaetes bacterium GWD1_61_31]OHD59281.1 MAG: hypothetical protein A2Y32_09785 [Spirochaetes bacterium GWF1_60_12]
MRRYWLIALLFGCSGLYLSAADRPLNIGLGPYPLELRPYRALYAHEMLVLSGLYEGLFSYHPETLEPLPAQAESYTQSADGRRWTFRLRGGLRWSDGSRLTAADYVESWRYMLLPSTASEFAGFFDIIVGARAYRSGQVAAPDGLGIVALDERTLQIELNAPAAYFTRLLCHSAFVPIHVSQRAGAAGSAGDLIGNGPYRLDRLDAEALHLVRNPAYWDQAHVAIGEIIFRFLDDEVIATARFNSGELLWLTDMIDSDSLTRREGIQYAAMFGTGYYYWNCRFAPWSDARVRRALALVVPWPEIRNGDNYLTPTDRLVLPFGGYRDSRGLASADQTEARALLQAAGFAEPALLPALTMLVPDNPQHRSNAGLMAEAWQRLGLEVSIQVLPANQFARAVRQADYTLAATSWIGDFADPAAFLMMWTSDSALNAAGYRGGEYDALIAASMLQAGSARLATLAQAETILLQEAVVMPTNHLPSINLVDTELLRGWFINPLDTHPLKALYYGTIQEPPFLARAETQGD